MSTRFSACPVRARLADGRWHFQHGPIDLVISVDGDGVACATAVETCWTAFSRVLDELVKELPDLRRQARSGQRAHGPVADRMVVACGRFATSRFITPMAAVAGAVADELISSFQIEGVRRASINNGGDIAFHLQGREQYRVGVFSNIDHPPQDPSGRSLDGSFLVTGSMPLRGIATSGWRGRSFSLGVADSVTVLARAAADADAAATLIANAVNCEDPRIVRKPANTLKDDSDLGDRLVTVAVPALAGSDIASALAAGRQEAEHWLRQGIIYAAALFLQGGIEVVANGPGVLPQRPRNH
jgi:ApbE superfamily uncharacterized protein (UPF0280 family)